MADNKGQIIITIGREYGSLGHLIADKAGKKLGLPVLDKALLHKMAENHGFDPRFIKDYDEKKRNPFTSRSINGHTNSIEDVLAEMVFKYERDLADTGESFIIVGRCAEEVLKDRPGLIRVFITGDYDTKLTHLVKDRGFTEREAADLMKKMDNKRRSYFSLRQIIPKTCGFAELGLEIIGFHIISGVKIQSGCSILGRCGRIDGHHAEHGKETGRNAS